MPRVLFIPTATTWSFDEQAPPVAWTLPGGNGGGNINLGALTSGSTPLNPQGVIFSVSFDGVLTYTSPCMTSGGVTVPVPPGTLTIDVTMATGCNGGTDVTSGSVSGAGA